MAKKPAVNMSQSIRDFLATNPGAMPVDVVKALKKDGVTVTTGLVSNIKTKLNKAGKAMKAAKPAAVAAAVPAPAAVEKPAKPNGTITLEQIKKVAQTIKTLGGFERMTEVLEVIKEAGGVKKFKDLAEAMTPSSTDDISI